MRGFSVKKSRSAVNSAMLSNGKSVLLYPPPLLYPFEKLAPSCMLLARTQGNAAPEMLQRLALSFTARQSHSMVEVRRAPAYANCAIHTAIFTMA